MSRHNPFQTFAHCWRYALRRARADGDTFHVVSTGEPAMRRTILSDRDLFARDDVEPDHIEASADPFALNAGAGDTL